MADEFQRDAEFRRGGSPGELLPFLARDFGPMNSLCERAEMFQDRIYGRTGRCSSISTCRLKRRLLLTFLRLGRGESRGGARLNGIPVGRCSTSGRRQAKSSPVPANRIALALVGFTLLVLQARLSFDG